MLIEHSEIDAEEARLWQESARQVVPELEAGDESLLAAIQEFADTWGYSFDEVADNIRQSEMFAACFAKDPKTGRRSYAN